MLGACLSSVSRFQCSSGSLCSNVAVCSLNSCDSGMRPYVGCRTDGLRIDTSVPSSSSYLRPLTTTSYIPPFQLELNVGKVGECGGNCSYCDFTEVQLEPRIDTSVPPPPLLLYLSVSNSKGFQCQSKTKEIN